MRRRRKRVHLEVAVALLALASGAAGCSDPSPGGPGSGGNSGPTTGGSAGAPAGGTSSAGAEVGGGGSSNGPRVCAIQAPTECAEPAPKYADVEPIFASRCVVCHGATPGGPWPLNTYGHVATWRDTIRAALLTCAMPPAEAEMPLPDAESLLILHWIRCGMPP